MTKNVFWPLFRWIFANAILPIVVPIIILIIGDELAVSPTHNYGDTIQKLVLEGFYILSSMTLFFSLLETYKEFKEASSSNWLLIMFLPMAIICIIFYQTEQVGVSYFQTHKTIFIGSWLILIAYATFLKYKILNYRYIYRYGR